MAPDAAVTPDCQLAPERLARLELELGPIPGLSRPDPSPKSIELPGVVLRAEESAAQKLESVEAPPAEIVLSALEYRELDVALDNRCRDRDVVTRELCLQRLCGGGDDDSPTREESRQEIGETLAGACSSLGNQMLAGVEGAGDCRSERALLLPHLEALERCLKPAAGPVELLHTKPG